RRADRLASVPARLPEHAVRVIVGRPHPLVPVGPADLHRALEPDRPSASTGRPQARVELPEVDLASPRCEAFEQFGGREDGHAASLTQPATARLSTPTTNAAWATDAPASTSRTARSTCSPVIGRTGSGGSGGWSISACSC